MKTKRGLRLIAWVILLMGLLTSNHLAAAQSYRFAVPELNMQVYVQPDASVKIVYDITFENYGSTIDVVDIGLPHKDYRISTMKASINGVNLGQIYKSEYIDIGVEVHLGSQSIPRGGRGTLHFECTMPNLVYQDTTRKEYASLQITPTWFDANSVQGTGKIQIAIYMLEGISPDDMLYQKEPFTNKAMYQGRAAALWQWTDKKATSAHLVGVSFPKQGMQQVMRMSLFELANKWLIENPVMLFFLGMGGVLLFGFLFFRFTGGTGISLFVILLGVAGLITFAAPFLLLLALPAFVVLIIINETSLKKRRKTYLPAVAQVEGGGIKRGLTAPEAAVLLEMPLNKVLTLVIFGMLEKGLLRQVQEAPLKVEVVEEFRTIGNPNITTPKERRDFWRDVAQRKGTVIHAYEEGFLHELEKHPDAPIKSLNFSGPMKALIEITVAKMKGFDLSDTQDYYRRVMTRAMEQAQAIGEIEQREQYLDKYLPWVMLNDSYPTVMTHHSYHYWPRWSHPRHIHGGLSASRPSGSSSRPAVGGRTTAGDVAGSFAGWAENTMGGLAGALLPGSMNLPGGKGGFIDLSGADRITGDIFEAMAKASASSGSGGGGGRSCACAGCACACACAGGGR
ncbi:MAG TPA: hypothetical protein PKH77_21920 [Anaerolineae bacterium]|nr:hypothetical protein [Anaerolineae bacterium]